MRIVWVLRLFLYSFVFGRAGWLGYLGAPLYVKGLRRLFIGYDFRLFPGARIEALGKGRILVGDYFRGGHNLFVTCTNEDITIGSHCIFSANIFIGTQKNDFSNNDGTYDKNWFKQGVTEFPIVLGNRCFIGFGAVILPGASLGEGCVVGANAVVSGSYPENSIISGYKSTLLSRQVGVK